jgi:hypothetical protein
MNPELVECKASEVYLSVTVDIIIWNECSSRRQSEGWIQGPVVQQVLCDSTVLHTQRINIDWYYGYVDVLNIIDCLREALQEVPNVLSRKILRYNC